MSNSVSPRDLYERQLNSIEDLLSFHPDYIGVLTPQEQYLFRKYFLPDWREVTDFWVYHERLVQDSPGIEDAATGVLSKFLTAHSVDPAYLLDGMGP